MLLLIGVIGSGLAWSTVSLSADLPAAGPFPSLENRSQSEQTPAPPPFPVDLAPSLEMPSVADRELRRPGKTDVPAESSPIQRVAHFESSADSTSSDLGNADEDWSVIKLSDLQGDESSAKNEPRSQSFSSQPAQSSQVTTETAQWQEFPQQLSTVSNSPSSPDPMAHGRLSRPEAGAGLVTLDDSPDAGSSPAITTIDAIEARSDHPRLQILQSGQYDSQIGLAGRAGYSFMESFGRANSLADAEILPYLYDGQSLYYGDVRFFFADETRLGSNLGLGVRRNGLGFSDWAGASIWLDLDHVYDRTFTQLGVGLDGGWGIVEGRVNGYFPTDDSSREISNQILSSVVQGNDRITLSQVTSVQPMTGFDWDVSVSKPVWNSRLRGSIGSYHFYADDVDDIHGIKLSGELEREYLTLSTRFTHDETFGSNVSVGVGFQWPQRNVSTGNIGSGDLPVQFADRNYNVILGHNVSLRQSIVPIAGSPPTSGGGSVQIPIGNPNVGDAEGATILAPEAGQSIVFDDIVSDLTSLQAALDAALGGEVIGLQPGDYGDLRLFDLTYSSPVMIASVDRDDLATFQSIMLTNIENLVLSDLSVQMIPTTETFTWNAAIDIRSSSNIAVANSVLRGGLAVSGLPESAEPGTPNSTGGIIGRPIGRGMTISNSQNIAVENNAISDFHLGIVLQDARQITISGNRVHDLRTSPLVGESLEDILITSNHFHTSRPWKLGGLGDHADFIHFWTDGSDNSDITIRDNLMQQGDGQAIVGIYLASDTQFGFKNINISGNIIHNGDRQAIRIESTDGFVIANNTLLQTSGGPNNNPSIIVTDKNGHATSPRNGIVENNVSGGIDFSISESSRATIIERNNLMLQGFDASRDDFIGYHYLNVLERSANLADFSTLPGSLPDLQQAGSHLTLLSASDAGRWFFDHDQQDHVYAQEFSAERFQADVDPNATYTWNFGDGTTATGANTNHRFASGGLKDITLTVQSEGTSTTIHRTIFIRHNTLVDLNFDNQSVANSSPLALGYEWENRFATGVNGTAAAFSGTDDNLTIQYRPELVGMESLVIDFDLKFDATTNSQVRPVWSHGHYGIEWIGNSANAFITTEDGTTHQISGTANVQDLNWHTAQLNYNSNTGLFQLSFDGSVIASTEGVSGKIIGTQRDLYIGGSSFEDTMHGRIDNLSIRLFE